MKKFLLFVALLVGLDFFVGAGLSELYSRTRSGEAGGLTNWALSSQAEVLILGSSRAKHHISPAILGEALQARVLNFGINGQEFLYASTLFKLWTEKHGPPRAVILHVDPGTLADNNEELERMAVFSFYVDHPYVRDVLYSISPFERLKYLSRAYRFNGKVLPIFKNAFTPPRESFDGYEPLAGKISNGVAESGIKRPTQLVTDGKVARLREMIDYCKQNKVQLVLVHSPAFQEDHKLRTDWIAAMEGLLQRFPGPQFLSIDEFTFPEVFAGKSDLFRDAGHLNATGAELFSHLLAGEIRKSFTMGPSDRIPAADGTGR